jgi:hypothetical protein
LFHGVSGQRLRAAAIRLIVVVVAAMPALPAIVIVVVFALGAPTLIAAPVVRRLLYAVGSLLADRGSGRGAYAGADHCAFLAGGFVTDHSTGSTTDRAAKRRVTPLVEIGAATESADRQHH